MSANSRALHYVFRVGNRQTSYDFYIKTLGMRVLRHEEFDGGCKATCNGPYGGKWSKTMVGYGDEDDHYVMELTYNYGISHYELGNDYRAIHIESDAVVKHLQEKGIKPLSNELFNLHDPDGHLFIVSGGKGDLPISKVALNVKNISDSKEFWHTHCRMQLHSEDKGVCLLSYGEKQCKLELHDLGGTPLNRGEAFGRLAFSCPSAEQKGIEERVKAVNPHYIQNSLVSLDTPGKATVTVVILRDPNDHEICYVGDEAYRELSIIDPKGNELLQKAIKNDESVKH